MCTLQKKKPNKNTFPACKINVDTYKLIFTLSCLLKPHKKCFDEVKWIISSVQYSKQPTFSYPVWNGSKYAKQVKIRYLRCTWPVPNSSGRFCYSLQFLHVAQCKRSPLGAVEKKPLPLDLSKVQGSNTEHNSLSANMSLYLKKGHSAFLFISSVWTFLFLVAL